MLLAEYLASGLLLNIACFANMLSTSALLALLLLCYLLLACAGVLGNGLVTGANGAASAEPKRI